MITDNVYNVYKEAIQKSACGFAYHAAVFDGNNRMIDYILLDVNQTFEELTGLKKENIINKRFLMDVAQNKAQAERMVKIFEKVVNRKSSVIFDDYSEEYRRHFSIIAYSTENDRFVTLFMDKTIEIKMQEVASYFINNMDSRIDYEKIAEFAYALSRAQYVAFNLFDKKEKTYTTVAMHGATERFNKLKSLNTDVIDRSVPEVAKTITYFDSLHKYVRTAVSERRVMQVEKEFDVGNVVVTKIMKDNKILGDFTLFYKKGEKLLNPGLFQLFLSQLGLFIEKTKLEHSLRSCQSRFFVLAEYAPVGFLSCNIKGEVSYSNKKFLEIMESTSFDKTEVLNLLDTYFFKDIGFSDKLSECMQNDREITCEMTYKSIWGKDCWLRVHYNPYKENSHVVGANIVIDDITDKKIREEALKEQALHDPLTDAYNRNALDTILVNRLNESKEKQLLDCFALVDIDNFKNINENYGHEVGDRVLKYLTTRVQKELRSYDIVVRTCGDEFLIYLYDIKTEKNAQSVVERIFNKISTKYRFIDNTDGSCYSFSVSCSIGVSFYPRDGENVNELMTKANAALYKVKNKGKADYLIEL